ncbi:uncharacterized protein LOC121376747 [Gigantopelta aegis]|nr:uncharacterized protein LOC121376747 [Gigantopelta aegis]
MSHQPMLQQQHEENQQQQHYGNNNSNNNHHHHQGYNHHHNHQHHLASITDNLHAAEQARTASANNIFHSSLQKFYEGYKVASHDTERFSALSRSFSDSYNLAKEQLLSPSLFNARYSNQSMSERKEEVYKSEIENCAAVKNCNDHGVDRSLEDRNIDRNLEDRNIGRNLEERDVDCSLKNSSAPDSLSEKPYSKSIDDDSVEKQEKEEELTQGIPIPSFYDNFKLSKDGENVKLGDVCEYEKTVNDEDVNKGSSILNSSLNDSYRSEDNSSPDCSSNQRPLYPHANSLDRSSTQELSRSFSYHNSTGGGNLPAGLYEERGYPPNRRYSLPTPPLSEYFRSPVSSTSPTASSVSLLHASNIHPNSAGIYFCHLCSYSGKCKDLFDEHMSIHFEYSCPHCDYTSRTEGRLKRHIKDFHTNEDPNNPNKVQRTMPGRPKVYRCKQCEFSTITKVEFWQHARSHIKEEKLLQCPRCPFVTEYKHHLEYHLRNHFGSKPFKCNKCNYSCVNKSMLNSHMKSHTNVYQYRCADCTYATKYCHSLKLHLRKYNHKPAAILNNDGSLPQGLDIESAGLSLLAKRGPPRGPRGPRKEKNDHFGNLGPLFNFPMSSMAGMTPPMTPGMTPGMNAGLMSPYWPLMNHIPNGIHHPPPPPPPPLVPTSKMGSMGSMSSMVPTTTATLQSMMSSPDRLGTMMKGNEEGGGGVIRCNLCVFTADSADVMSSHVVKVHAHAENQDLFTMFGISSEALLDEHANKSRQNRMHKPMMHLPASHSYPNSNSMLHVQTESESDASKTSPHSWPRNSIGGGGGRDSVGERMQQMMSYSAESQSLPELYSHAGRNRQESVLSQADDATDILKQMTLKFGGSMSSKAGPRKETPLDLTKPKSVSPEIPSSHMHHMPSYLKRPSSEEEMASYLKRSAPEDDMPSYLKRSAPEDDMPSYLKRSAPEDDMPSYLKRSAPEDDMPSYLKRSAPEDDMPSYLKRSTPKKDMPSYLKRPTPENDMPSYLKRSAPEEEMKMGENPTPPSQEVVEASPRKRSRKGKAYKLDTLCLKLQEKQNGSSYESESDESTEASGEMKVEREDMMMTNACQKPSPKNGVADDGNCGVNDGDNNDDDDDEEESGMKCESDPNTSLKADLEQIHNNIQFMNNQLQHDSEVKRQDYVMDKSEVDTPEAHDSRSPVTRDVPSDKDLHGDVADPASDIAHSVFTNRRKPMTPALRRGTELAWKILNDPSTPVGNPKQSSEIVLETPPRNGPVPLPHSNGASHLPLPHHTVLPNGISHLKQKGFPHGLEHYECPYCEIAFRNCIMYTMHMGYHGYQDPYKCNMCGHCAKDKVDFFLHIARAAHS